MSVRRKVEIALEELDSSSEFGFEFANRDGTWGASPELWFGSEKLVLDYVAGSDSDGFVVFSVRGDGSGGLYRISFLTTMSRCVWLSGVDEVKARTVTVYESEDE